MTGELFHVSRVGCKASSMLLVGEVLFIVERSVRYAMVFIVLQVGR